MSDLQKTESAARNVILNKIRTRVITDLFSPPSGQLDALNGLRGIGCLIVIAHHVASFTGNLSYGPNNADRIDGFFKVINQLWIGVDIFFVISGFLIGRILMNNITRTGSVGFPRFFLRRAMRVFPAFYLVLTLAIFWYTKLDIPYSRYLLVGPGGWDAMYENSWLNYIYAMNYFYGAGIANPMGWTWTLCVEEHFYLFLPAVLVLLYRSSKPWVIPTGLITLITLPVLGRGIQFALDPNLFQGAGFFYQTHNRVDEILVGVFVAYLYVYHKSALQAFAIRAGSLCWITAMVILLIVGVYGGINKLGLFSVVFQYFLVAVAIGLLIINGLFLDNGATRILTSHKPYLISRVSYGIYLLHPYVLFFILQWHDLFPDPGALSPWSFLLLYTLTFSATTVLAGIMFICVERPLIDLGVRWTERKPSPIPTLTST